MKIQFNFRIEENQLKKLKYIAEENDRTASQEINMLIRKYILKYETENGQIEI